MANPGFPISNENEPVVIEFANELAKFYPGCDDYTVHASPHALHCPQCSQLCRGIALSMMPWLRGTVDEFLADQINGVKNLARWRSS